MLEITPDEEREAIDYAWEIGRLNYLMRNTQRLIKKTWIESKGKSRKFYTECTRRLGKSSLLLILMSEECLSSPGLKCGFFAPVKDGLLDYIEPLILKTYASCPERLRPRFDRSRFILNFANGSTIIFRGSNNQQHRIRRGQEFHLASIDEARDVDRLNELIDSVVFPALFSTNGYLIISSTPADTRSHPLFAIRNIAKAEGWYVELTMQAAQGLDPQVYTQERINEWKTETLKSPGGQEIWEREYECKWVVNKTRMAVPEWNSAAYSAAVVFGPDPYRQFYRHYVGIDWGYKDFTAAVFATLNFRKARLEVEGELTTSGKDVRSDLIAQKMSLQHKHLWGAEDVKIRRQVSDSADPILINELNKFKHMNFVPVQKAQTLEAMLNEFRVLVSQGKIVVKDSCPMLLHDLENAIWTEKRDKLDKDVFAHHFDHLMALVYLTRTIDWSDNPIPNDYMVDGVRIVDLNWDRPKAGGKSAQTLEAVFGRRK